MLLLVSEAIPGLITQAGYDTLPFQFLLWVNLPPVIVEPLNLVWWTLPVELGFPMNFLPGVLSSWARRRLFWCGALAWADTMATELKRGVLDGTLDSSGVEPNGCVRDRAAGL